VLLPLCVTIAFEAIIAIIASRTGIVITRQGFGGYKAATVEHILEVPADQATPARPRKSRAKMSEPGGRKTRRRQGSRAGRRASPKAQVDD
jgi:hypothetical protein